MFKIIVEGSSLAEIQAGLNSLKSGVAHVSPPVYTGPAPGAEQGDEGDEGGPPDANAPPVDTKGFPWDGRIHSDNRKTNADGSWRKRRGVSDATVAAVEAELNARNASAVHAMPPMQPPAPHFMPPPVQPMMQPPAPVAPPMPQFTQPPVQPMMQPPAPVAPPAPPVGQEIDFHTFMHHLSNGMQTDGMDGQKVIHPAYMEALCQWLGVTNISEVATQPTLIKMAVEQLVRDGRWL